MFDRHDFDRVRASLGSLLHNFDGVDSTLRVIEKDLDGTKVALISDFPPMPEEDTEVVVGLLEDRGLEMDIKAGQVYVTGVADGESFDEFMNS